MRATSLTPGSLTGSALPGNLIGIVAPSAAAPVDAFRADFAAWLPNAQETDSSVAGLLDNFIYPSAPTTARFVYPRLTAELILWHLVKNDVATASTLATKLISWQQTATGTTAQQRTCGGWPSVVAQSSPGVWVACAAADGTGTPEYYSHDCLVILTALCELYNRNSQPTFKAAAILAGAFIKNMIALPVAAGYDLATANITAPGQFVDATGSWDFNVYGSVAYAYIGGMDILSTITGDASYSTFATGARAFYAAGQHAQGWWYDHYVVWSNFPDFPIQPYTAANWTIYSVGNNQIVADNVMHSAIGAAKAGATAAVTATLAWLATAIGANGGVPGYLAPGAAGADGFNGAPVYYDIVSAAEMRSISQWANQLSVARLAVAFVEACEDADGGFLWGRFKNEGNDATTAGGDNPSAQAPHTGMWSTADLSVFGTSRAPAIAYDDNLWPAKRLVSIAVTPAGQDIGSPQQFTAIATYDDDTTTDVTSKVVWFSDDTSKMTVSAGGLGTKVGAGAFNMYATIGRISAHAFNVVS